MGKPRDDRSKDLFRPALDEIIDMSHAQGDERRCVAAEHDARSMLARGARSH
jgi:hypothetical protein